MLLGCIEGVSFLVTEHAAQVRLLELGPSGLRFELRVWINDPGERDTVLDQVNVRIYKAFAAAKIEIPFPKQDLYIRAFPTVAPQAASS